MKTYLQSLVLITLFGLLCILSGCPQPTVSTLNVPLIPQETSMWCWAASGEMCMDFLGYDISQCTEANNRFGFTDCCDNPTPQACVQGGWPEFNKYGFTYSITNNAAISWNELVNQIDSKKAPVAFTWAWDGGGGHMMVAIGYQVTDNGTQYVKINDPWPPNVGKQKYITYSAYVSGSGYTHWDDYYNITNTN